MEIWKDIDGTNGRYQVSSEGRVRRVFTDPRYVRKYDGFRYMKLVRHKGKRTDYLAVALGGERQELIHRLVANAFLPNPEHLPQVNHINGNGCDNRVENLEWCTNRENALHAKENGWTRPYKEAVPIKCMENGIVFGSSFEAADFVNRTKYMDSHRIKSLACNIRLCANGNRPSAYGYHWTKQF